jgi:hypothetical protein
MAPLRPYRMIMHKDPHRDSEIGFIPYKDALFGHRSFIESACIVSLRGKLPNADGSLVSLQSLDCVEVLTETRK